MNDISIDLDKAVLKRVTKTGLITGEPCYLLSICGVTTSYFVNTYSIYDGHTPNDNFLLTLVSQLYSFDFRSFNVPVLCGKGLYVVFSTHAEELYVQYLPVKSE